MLYLLDANVLISAERLYYPLAQIPEYWSWLLYYAGQNNLKLPREILREVLEGGQDKEKDPLLQWLKTERIQEALTLNEEATQQEVWKVISEGYAFDLLDSEVETVGRDPILIAYAKRQSSGMYNSHKPHLSHSFGGTPYASKLPCTQAYRIRTPHL